MNTINSLLDLNEVKKIIFNNIELLLNSFNLEYEQVSDNIFMKCPIHEGSDNPHGVSISLSKQTWKCWTRGCHEHYKHDIFGLVKGLLQTDSFSEALRYISKLYDLKGTKLVANYNSNNNKCDDTNDFHDCVKSINRYKKTNEHNETERKQFEPRDDKNVSTYFLSRGYREETLRFFRVQDSLEKEGPLKYRAIIPIIFNNKDVGYIARSTKEWLEPKYIFSTGFKKTEYLYNYDNAIDCAISKNCMFLVEGQGDVWKLWECGIKHAVGLFGKEISLTQRKLLLESGITRLIILTDNDQAGRESKIKIKRDLGRLFKLVFPHMHTKDLGNMFIENIKNSILLHLKGYC